MAVETTDGFDAVEWLASQEWCNGRVGMFGSSYGGFTSYQVAMLQPPSLKAIVPIYATDDRYTDDCHYKGGALKGYYDVGTYGTMMVSLNGLPPDPELFGTGWEEEWERTLEANTPYMLNWLANQRDGDYWRPGSLRGQYEKIEAATFIIGGWQDGYPNPPLRSFSNLRCDKKVLVGPWNHSRPDVAIPGPRINYLNEMRRWFDVHLKHLDDGVSTERPVTLYVQEFDKPDQSRLDTSGYWVSTDDWDSRTDEIREFFLGGTDASGSRRLSEKPVISVNNSRLHVDPATGVTGGLWSGGLPFGLPGDQRRDEALGLTFTSAPLQEDLVIAGNPVLTLTASSNSTNPLFVAKLSDVGPSGESALICRGVLNGSRLSSMTDPQPMDDSKSYRASIELDATAWKFSRGHRVRLSISGSDFPNSWPAKSGIVINIETGGENQSLLQLPVLTADTKKSPEFTKSTKATYKSVATDPPEWRTSEDPLTGNVTLTVNRASTNTVRDGVEFTGSDSVIFSTNRNNGDESRIEGKSTSEISYDAVSVRSVGVQKIDSDSKFFHWEVDLTVTKDGQPIHERTWKQSFPRDLM